LSIIRETTKLQKPVAVVFQSSEEYMPYCGIALYSLLKHADENRVYQVYILTRELSVGSQHKLRTLLEHHSNATLEIVNVEAALKQYDIDDTIVIEGSHLPLECYFKLLCPWLFPTLEKALYLDCDLVVQEDVAPLFDTDISELSFAAAHYARSECEKDKDIIHINSGVLLMNLSRIRAGYSIAEIFDCAKKNRFRILDQDLIDTMFQGEILILSSQWNARSFFYRDDWRQHVLFSQHDDVAWAIQNPKIVHYNGLKPWQDVAIPAAKFYLETAQETPFYDVVLNSQRVWRKKYNRMRHKIRRLIKRLAPSGFVMKDALLKPNCPRVFVRLGLYFEVGGLRDELNYRHKTHND
jgi:lipopolysaccharide biosynthesis glycosyltransferase